MQSSFRRAKRLTLFVVTALVALIAACSSPTKNGNGSGADADSTNDAGSTTQDASTSGDASRLVDASNSAERTLDSCATNIDADVPAFFKTFFKCVDISVDGTDVVISTQDLPPHKSYYYGEGSPNYAPFDTSRGSMYHPNPNTLAAQNIEVRIPMNPTSKGLTIDSSMVDTVMGTSPEEYGGGPRGVALDSVALFNDEAKVGDDIANEKYTFDDYNAHPAMTTYHYHTSSPGPLEVLAKLGMTTSTTPTKADVEMYGIMCDGTVVLGCTELDGTPVDPSKLDAQNGHVGDIKGPDGTPYFMNRYHVHICGDQNPLPYTPEIQYYQDCQVIGGAPR